MEKEFYLCKCKDDYRRPHCHHCNVDESGVCPGYTCQKYGQLAGQNRILSPTPLADESKVLLCSLCQVKAEGLGGILSENRVKLIARPIAEIRHEEARTERQTNREKFPVGSHVYVEGSGSATVIAHVGDDFKVEYRSGLGERVSIYMLEKE